MGTNHREAQDVLVGAERIQQSPVVEVLHSVVRAVIAAPTLQAFEATAIVDLALREYAAGFGSSFGEPWISGTFY